MAGDYPKSPGKIALVVVAIVVFILTEAEACRERVEARYDGTEAHACWIKS